METCRVEDLPDLLGRPLEPLASRHGELTETQVKVRVATALHEAAHIVAAGYCRAGFHGVFICPKGRSRRTGVLGEVHVAAALLEEEAFVSYVGYAWEETHGDKAQAANDLRDGDRYADAGNLPREALLDEARKFVREGEDFVWFIAACILALVPKTGKLSHGALTKLRHWLQPEPGDARKPGTHLARAARAS